MELLARPADADRLEEALLRHTSSIGARRWDVTRRALPRERVVVDVLGHEVALKVVTLPDGGRRSKPEFEDVRRVARLTGRTIGDIFMLAARAWEQL